MNGSALQARWAPVRAWWNGLALRERRLVTLAVVVLAAYGLVAVALLPAVRTLMRAPAERDALDAQYQLMQRLAAEAQALRATAPVTPDGALAALTAATERLGVAGRLQVQGDRAVLMVQGVGPSALGDWLAEARSGARAQPIEVNLARSARGYSGTVTVRIGAGG